MVNNFELIRSLLKFEDKDDFYFLQVIQRKKDALEGQKVNGTNNNSRLIKAYFIHSFEYFDFIEKEVIELCEVFNARASLNLSRRSYRKLSFQMQKLVADNIMNYNYNKIHKCYTSVCGKYLGGKDKFWIVDIDKDEIKMKTDIEQFINSIEPQGDKIVAHVPSKSGLHLITTPFNKKTFKDKFPSIDLQSNNPTNLYIP